MLPLLTLRTGARHFVPADASRRIHQLSVAYRSNSSALNGVRSPNNTWIEGGTPRRVPPMGVVPLG